MSSHTYWQTGILSGYSSDDDKSTNDDKFPATTAECWEFGRQLYSHWKHLIRKEVPTAKRRLPNLGRTLDRGQSHILREVHGGQEQRRVSRYYGAVEHWYNKLNAILHENVRVKDQLVALGNHMRENNLVDGSDPTFPVNWTRKDWDDEEPMEEAREIEEQNKSKR